MYFKGPIWSFFQEKFDDIAKTLVQDRVLLTVSSYSPYVTTIIKERVRSQMKDEKGGEGYEFLFGSDITKKWVEETLQTPSLFNWAQKNKYVVQNSEQIPKETWDFLYKMSQEDTEDSFIFYFNKHSKFLENFQKKNKFFQHISITSPPFWDYPKYFNFFARYFGIDFTASGRKFFFDAVPHETEELYNTFRFLKLYYPDHKVLDQPDLAEVITFHMLDQFELAKLIGGKKFSHFYEKLLQSDPGFDALKIFFQFLQNHFLRLYERKKSPQQGRLSGYEQDIHRNMNLWSTGEIYESIQFFAKCELLAKKRSSELYMMIKRRFLLHQCPRQESLPQHRSHI